MYRKGRSRIVDFLLELKMDALLRKYELFTRFQGQHGQHNGTAKHFSKDSMASISVGRSKDIADELETICKTFKYRPSSYPESFGRMFSHYYFQFPYTHIIDSTPLDT